MLKRLGVALLALVALATLACSSGDSAGPSAGPGDNATEKTERDVGQTVVGEAGGVTVEVTWLTEREIGSEDSDLSRYPLSEFVLLKVQFTTHSGDLGRIDMVKAALLRTGQGESRPEGWMSLSDDAHHRAGFLAFRRQPGEGPVEMVLTMGDKEVTLVWKATLPP